MGLRDYGLYDFIRHNAATAGSAPAIISADQTITHNQFLERVDQLAAGFKEQGINKGDCICILAQNSSQYLELYGACAKTGAIAYPINWRLSAAEVREVLKLADPKMLVTGVGQLPQLESSDTSKFQLRAIIGPGSTDGFIPLADLYRPPTGKYIEVHPDDPFAIISTAAVEGVPRGAVLTHTNLIIAGYVLITELKLCAQDRHLAALPLLHITGLALSLSMIQIGGANVVLEAFDPAKAVQMMDEHDVSLMAVFPPILSTLLDARQTADASWGSLKHVFGLEAPETIQRLYAETKAKFWTGFGQAETSGLVTLVRVDTKPGATGKSLPMVRLRCVNESGDEVSVGEVGEIAVQSPIVFAGYWNDPDATNYTFRNDWHHTGDLGKLDEEGYLYYAGRKPEKDLIKSGGENVYPAEVEHVLQDLPQVAAVCVIGVADERWGEAVKAVVELVSGATMTADQISSAVAEQIASYKKPRYVDFVEALQRTPDGEIDRAAVKAAHGKI